MTDSVIYNRAKLWLLYYLYWSRWLMGHTRHPEKLTMADLQVFWFCYQPESWLIR
jgi:hypothetical protein